MPGVSSAQITQAKRMTAIEFLQRYRAQELVPAKSHGEFQLRSHDSFKINAQTSFWHWKSRDIGGRSALDYLIKVEGMKFVDAVLALCEQAPGYIPPEPQPEKKPPFALPAAAVDNRRVYAYLLRRGISRNVIDTCIRAGILYESAKYHNAVFVGRDETGVARYAFLRGTYSRGEPFKAEAPGSDKRYSFCVPPKQQSGRVAVYEAAIDVLAHWSLEHTQDKFRLSLAGIYAPADVQTPRPARTPAALDAFLDRHPEIREIEVCTDNDQAGRYAAEQIKQAYQDRYCVCLNLPSREGFDYADITQEMAARQRAVISR